MRGFLSVDIDVSDLHINQCNLPITRFVPSRTNQLSNHDDVFNEIDVFHNSHKCHEDSMQVPLVFDHYLSISYLYALLFE